MAKTAEKVVKTWTKHVPETTPCVRCSHHADIHGDCESYAAPYNSPMRKLNGGLCPTFINNNISR